MRVLRLVLALVLALVLGRPRRGSLRDGLALLGAAFAVAAVACGEDVDFSSGRAVDAGAALADAASGVDAPVGAVDGGDARDEAGRDAPCSSGSDAALACRPNGAICRATKDCCSGRCEGGYCLKLGTCAAPGAPCSTRSSCCSGRCEPTGRSGALACGQYCLADGARCSSASDCCGVACNGGTCGGPLCSVVGTTCQRDSECCSGRCNGGRCGEAPASCLPTGEGCGVDAGAQGPFGPGLRCCSDVCDPRTARCDLGPGGCRETSTPCDVDSDCCRGTCRPDGQLGNGGVSNAGVSVCTAPCLADGQDCNSNGDCCDGVCGGVESQCGIPMAACP